MEHTGNMATTENNQRSFQLGIFTTSDVLKSFNVDFLDEAWCRAWITEKLHGNEARCPKCDWSVSERLESSFWGMKRIKCGRCGVIFTTLSGTFLTGTHLDCRGIVLLALLLAIGVQEKEIARIVDISAESVRLWRHRFEAISLAKNIRDGE